MMKTVVVVILCLVAVSAFDEAEQCTPEVCLSEDGCYCASSTSPIGTANTPQFVILTSDDAVTDYIYNTYWIPLVENRTNPDGSRLSGTIFVPHEYTDYERVNNLYNAGFEIGVNSITKNSQSSYWAEADVDTLNLEFDGARKLVSYFANIPIESVRGARTPFLQLNGNITFESYNESGLSYDSSWPALTGRKLFPYTLDYLSSQQCSVGSCPNEAHPGFWVVPINNIKGQDGADCNALMGCVLLNETADVIAEWLEEQFRASYDGNRTPLTVMVNSAWFQSKEGALEAAVRFLDYLGELDDVFVVSESQVIDWMLDPVVSADYRANTSVKSAPCDARTCILDFSETEIRYMRSCVACPSVYPWIGNPLGQSS